MKLAACVVIVQDGKVLAVPRRGTTDQWGLPGGKVNPSESIRHTAVREILEETNLKLDVDKLTEIHGGPDDNGFIVITYAYEGTLRGELKQGDTGEPKWITWDELISGPYPKYNTIVRDSWLKLQEIRNAEA